MDRLISTSAGFLVLAFVTLLSAATILFIYNNVEEETSWMLATAYEQNKSLIRENTQLTKELSELNLKEKNNYLVYTMLKDAYFEPSLSGGEMISLAILLQDKDFCDKAGSRFCHNILENNCRGYTSPGREICIRLSAMVERDITSDNLISHCNDKAIIENDFSQARCFRDFAKITGDINLCNEICREPIDNTLCQAQCENETGELVPCKKFIGKVARIMP